MASNDSPSLMAAVEEIRDALLAHAHTVLTRGDDVTSVISAISRLGDAVLRYEGSLIRETGWSNPIRHLPQLPMNTCNDRAAGAGSDAAAVPRVRVTADYLVEVRDEELLGDVIDGRGGGCPDSVAEAVRFLFESDGWDIHRYPPDRLLPLGVDVDISVER